MVEEIPQIAQSIDFGTKVSDMEERQRLLKERVLLIGQNLVSMRDESLREIGEIKREVEEMKLSLEKLKSLMERLIEESSQFARKDELAIIARQMKMFSPLEAARIKDVEKMIKEAIKR